jgi:glycerophosphoryl diester phosphodiesterase
LRLLTIDNDHPIPTLDEVFATFGRRTLYNVELKALGRGDDALAAAVARAIAAHGVAEQVLISSFSPFTLRAARRHLPPGVPWPCCASGGPPAPPTPCCAPRPTTPTTR